MRLAALLIGLAVLVEGCEEDLAVDIGGGISLANGDVLWRGLALTPKSVIRKEGKLLGCICDVTPCVRKCCPPNEYLVNKSCEASDVPFAFTGLPLVYGSNCSSLEKRRYFLDNDEAGDFAVNEEGALVSKFLNLKVTPQDYCVDYIEDTGSVKALVCQTNVEKDYTTNVIGMLISMPFLLLTFIVYLLLPDRNLHGKCLMCYVITLFGAYLLLVFAQLNTQTLESAECITIGMLSFFFFMVSFFFMNVMSVDIWWTFSGCRGLFGSSRESERKRFLVYSVYAWGIPLLLVIVVLSLTLDPSLKATVWYNPGIGYGQCWFAHEIGLLLYFYGPIAFLILLNVIFFIITAFKIKKVQRETAVLKGNDSKKHSYEKDKQKFNLYLKLMLAMGVNWSTEIISWALIWSVKGIPESIWYLTDFINALYGVFIFFIFAFKQNIWRALKRRYNSFRGKPTVAPTITMVDYSPRPSPNLQSATNGYGNAQSTSLNTNALSA